MLKGAEIASGISSVNVLIGESIPLQPLAPEVVWMHIRSGQFRITNYPQDHLIHGEGERCQQIEIILDGEIAIERIDAAGNLLTVAQCRRHELLGGNLIFASHPHYPMTLTTIRPTVLLAIRPKLLFDLLSQNPDFLRLYLQLVANHAYLLGDKIRHYVQKTIRESLVAFLRQAYDQQQTNPIRLGLSKTQLADRIGVQRTSVSRELAKMRQAGWLDYDRDSVTIRDFRLFRDQLP